EVSVKAGHDFRGKNFTAPVNASTRTALHTLSMTNPFHPRRRLPAAASISLGFCLLFTASVFGQVIHVPADQPNLTAAIAAVPDGGVIEMAGGTYQAPKGGFTIYDLPAPKGFT